MAAQCTYASATPVLLSRKPLSPVPEAAPKTGLSHSRSLVHRQTWRLKAAVHWERPGCTLAQSSPNLTWDAMWLRADSARRLSVLAEPLTRRGRAESARNPIAANEFGDDCANAQPGLSHWTAVFTVFRCVRLSPPLVLNRYKQFLKLHPQLFAIYTPSRF